MDTLREVKSYMEFWGWENGGNPGSVKRDCEGHVVASYGSLIWTQDVEKACDTIKRIADREERLDASGWTGADRYNPYRR